MSLKRLLCIIELLQQLLVRRQSNMKISEEGLSLIKKFEGCELNAYEDAVGIPTIAYGRIKNVKMGKNSSLNISKMKKILND